MKMIRAFRSFRESARGNLTVVASFGLLAVTLTVGSGIDYGHVMQVRLDLAAKLDGAVLAAASGTTDPVRQVRTAEAFFKHATKGQMPTYSAKFTSVNGQVTGVGEAVVPMALMGIAGINTMTVSGQSRAQSADALEPMCLMAMHETRSHTLELKDSVSVYAPDCNMYGNSNNTNDVIDPHNRTNFVTAKWVATIGGGHNYLENVTPFPNFGTKVIADPLASLALPTGGGNCIKTNYVIDRKNLKIPPGNYCGGLVIKNGSNVTLQDDGVYFIKGNKFSIDSSTLTGNNVLIVLVDSKVTIAWNKSTVRLSAPKTGDYAGIAVFADRTATTSNTFTDSTIDIHGVFYMPKGEFDWTNTGTPSITAKWSAFIVDGFSWAGDGTVNIPFDLATSDIPYPAALNKIPKPGKIRLLN